MNTARRRQTLRCFLAERFLPDAGDDALEALVDTDYAAAHTLPVRLLQTIYIPDDETCFTLLSAPSYQTLIEANHHSELGYQRILPAISIREATHPPRTG